jgi:hypothetical protein
MLQGSFMGANGPVANPFDQNMKIKLQGLGTGYGNGQDMFDAYGDAVTHALKLQPFGNQQGSIFGPSGNLSASDTNLLAPFVGGAPTLGANILQGQQPQQQSAQLGGYLAQPTPFQNITQPPQNGGMSMMQKWGVISPLLGAMTHSGGNHPLATFASMMSPLAFGLHKAKVF